MSGFGLVAGAGLRGDLRRDGVFGSQPDQRDWDSAGAWSAAAAGAGDDFARGDLGFAGWSGRRAGRALLLARLVKSMLYGLQPADPVSCFRRRGVADRRRSGGELASGAAGGFCRTDGGAAA
jgi:hypothetical protein